MTCHKYLESQLHCPLIPLLSVFLSLSTLNLVIKSNCTFDFFSLTFFTDVLFLFLTILYLYHLADFVNIDFLHALYYFGIISHYSTKISAPHLDFAYQLLPRYLFCANIFQLLFRSSYLTKLNYDKYYCLNASLPY